MQFPHEAVVGSPEDIIIDEEQAMIERDNELERLAVYNEKIECLLTVLLTEKERYVFMNRVPGTASFEEIAKNLKTTKSNTFWIMKTAERKINAFRKFLSLL